MQLEAAVTAGSAGQLPRTETSRLGSAAGAPLVIRAQAAVVLPASFDRA
jgi:hypothetical protein